MLNTFPLLTVLYISATIAMSNLFGNAQNSECISKQRLKTTFQCLSISLSVELRDCIRLHCFTTRTKRLTALDAAQNTSTISASHKALKLWGGVEAAHFPPVKVKVCMSIK